MNEITIDDMLSWADGVYGALGTEYAHLVTDIEISIAEAILTKYKELKE